MKVSAGLHSLLETFGINCFQARSGFWLNSVPDRCRAEVPLPCWLSAGSWSLPLEAARIHSHAGHIVPSSNGGVPLTLQISPTSTSAKSLLPAARGRSLLLRVHVIRLGPLDHPG